MAKLKNWNLNKSGACDLKRVYFQVLAALTDGQELK